MTKPKLKSLLSVSDAIASLNYDRVANFDEQSSKQCGLAYDGPAYKGLAAPTWARGEGAFAQEHLRILSGLYGVLRPFDCIRPYRLDMGTKLATADHADLYGYWGTGIAEQASVAVESYEEALEEFECLGRYWSVYKTEEGHLYYLDASDQHSQWEDPREVGVQVIDYEEGGGDEELRMLLYIYIKKC